MKKLILILFIATFILGCQTTSNYNTPPKSTLLINNHTAGSYLIKDAGSELDNDKTIIAASFVNIDNLLSSSSFGRISSQQVSTKFTNSGFHIVEVLLGKGIVVKEQQGEFLLSRKLQQISTQQNAQAVLVGTYAIGKNYVYITTKIINAVSSKTIASYDYKIELNSDIKELLKKK